MSKAWLKMIGTSEKPCPDSWEHAHVHFKYKPRDIHPGDHMVLYAVGRKKKLFALAEVTSEAYENGEEEWCYQMDVNYLVNLRVEAGVSIDQITTQRNLIGPIQRGSSYIELEPEEYRQAAELVRAASQSADQSSQTEQASR
jgi:hypothetical protein